MRGKFGRTTPEFDVYVDVSLSIRELHHVAHQVRAHHRLQLKGTGENRKGIFFRFERVSNSIERGKNTFPPRK